MWFTHALLEPACTKHGDGETLSNVRCVSIHTVVCDCVYASVHHVLLLIFLILRRHQTGATAGAEAEKEIDHLVLPNGDIYAQPKKLRGRKANSTEVEEYASETVSQHSFSLARSPSQLDTM